MIDSTKPRVKASRATHGSPKSAGAVRVSRLASSAGKSRAKRSERSAKIALNAARRRAAELLDTEIAFIFSDEFESMTRLDVNTEPAADTLHSEAPPQKSTARRFHVVMGMFDAPLLSAEGEQFLFRKMNYLKWRAAQMRSSLSDSRPSVAKLDEIDRCIAEAKEVRNRIAQCNLRLVAAIARKFSSATMDYEDLISEGNVVLLNAVNKFDYSRGFRFSTYATHAVQRHFYRQMQKKQKQKTTEIATPSDMMAETEMQPEEDFHNPQLYKLAKQMIASFGETLDSREHAILLGRFGLGEDGSPQTLKTLAAELGLSKERVRQLQVRALEKLRQHATDEKMLPQGM